MPNAQLVTERVTNWTASDRRRRIDIPVGVKYGSVPEKVVAVLEAVASSRPWLGVAVTEARLIADIAARYDVVVLGADKWAQVLDPAWYGGSTEARDEALARLPRVLVAPRAGDHPLRTSCRRRS